MEVKFYDNFCDILNLVRATCRVHCLQYRVPNDMLADLHSSRIHVHVHVCTITVHIHVPHTLVGCTKRGVYQGCSIQAFLGYCVTPSNYGVVNGVT
jgi:hypothetical protein